MALDIYSLVEDVMREWPATIRVFLDFRMNCVGCPIGTFHTVEDSCREHGVNVQEFVAALRRAAGLRTNTEARPAVALTSRSA